MKRQRSRGPQRSGNQNPNRAYESNGPDMRVRGSAQTVLERYGQAGRDAMSAGDRVLAENCFQHAEHYLRLIKATQPNFVPRTEMAIAGFPNGFDEDGEPIEATEVEGENNGENGQRESRDNRNWNNGENGRDNNRDNNRDRNNRGRNRNRDRYRPDRNSEQHQSEGDNQNENQGQRLENSSDGASEVNNNAPRDVPSEASENNNSARPPRQPRQRRPKQDKSDNGEKSFGDELPAFLTAPTPKVDAE